MKITYDITLKEDGHDMKYRCSKMDGGRLNKFDPKKAMGCLLIAFEHLSETVGFADTETGKGFRQWISDEKTKYGVK